MSIELSFSTTFRAAAMAELLALIDAGTGPGQIAYYGAATEDGTTYYLMGLATLTDPAGTITDGQLTLEVATQVSDATVFGYVAYAEILDSDGNVHATLPVVESTAPVVNAIAMPSRYVIQGAPLYLLSLTLG